MNHPAKILLVEDDSVILKATRHALEAAGYEVSAAITGAEGLRRAAASPPDLALLDRVLPDMDGVEVCRHLKADPSTARVFVVLVSGIKTSDDDRADGLETGADDYIIRPISNRELLARVQALLRIKQAEEKIRYQADLLANVSDAVISTDLNFVIRTWNRAAESMYGWREAEVVGKRVGEVLHTEYPADDQEQVLQQFLTEGDWKGEVIQWRKDGTPIPILASVSFIRDGVGNPTGVVAVNRDITERKQAEEQLRAAHAELQRLLAEAEHARRILLSVVEDQRVAEQALRENNRRLRVLNHLGLALAQTLDLPTIYRTAYEHVAQLVDCSCFGISRYDPATQTLRAEYMLDEGEVLDPTCFPPLTFRPDIPLQGRARALLTQQPEIVSVMPAPSSVGMIIVGRADDEHTPRSAMYVPIVARGQTSGLLELQSYHDNAYSASDGVLLGPVANQIGLAIENARLFTTLETERTLLRTLVEHLPDAVYAKDTAGRKTLANPVDVRNIGAASEAEVLGKTDFELFPRDLAEAFYADDQHVFQTGEPILNREEGITRPDGTRGWQLTSKVPIFDSAGQVVGLVGVGHDITDRKQAEELLRWVGQRYRSLFEEAPLMYIITRNQEGVPIILDCNRAFTDTLGYARDEVVGRPLTDLYTPESRTTLRESGYQQTLGDGVNVAERRLIARDGHVIETILTALPETDTQGNVTGTRAMFVDITARKQAEEIIKAYSEKLEQTVAERTRELRAAQEQLLRQERLTVLGQVAGGIAHDLRTPLGAIKNAAYLLNLLSDSPDAEVKEALDILNQEINAADRIITSLLNFTRPQRPARQMVKVDQVIAHALRRVNIPPTVQVERRIADVPTILADAGQLEQVFDNLILNAVQAMPDGGRLTITCQTVTVSGKPSTSGDTKPSVEGWIVVSIADTGTGIAPEHMTRLFEPLFTTKPKGIGLGLAMVKMLVESHGGVIRVESAAGQGSVFTVELPMNRQG